MKTKLFILACLTSMFAQQVMAQPKVVTDPRFARGATMAFGRIKSAVSNGGTAISKRGFCIAENPNPTIDDSVNTATLSNNGVIYWFKNLKPATKYYMRAYATNRSGETGYGEVIKFYTIPMGNVTYSLWRGEADDATYARILKAMDESCFYFNNMTSTVRDYDVAYSPGTPTADCNYTDRPHMNVGANHSYQRCGTIMHEMEHGLGLQNYSTQWSKDILRSGNGTGQWLGDRVTEALQFWDNNTTSVLNGDGIHMWPYGVNGANEDDGTDVLYLGNAMVCQALGEDGLEHSYQCFAEPYYALQQEDTIKYYIKNESESYGRNTAFFVPNKSNVLTWQVMTPEEAAKNDSAAWYITFTPNNQYYQFRNAATGQYLTYPTSGTNIKTIARETLTTAEDWHLMKGRVDADGLRGYWIIQPNHTNWTVKCLSAIDKNKVSTKAFDLANSAEAQRWLIMTMPEVEAQQATAIAALRAKASDLLGNIRKLADVPVQEIESGASQTFTDGLSALDARVAAATSTTELNTIISEADNLSVTFLSSVAVANSEHPFDLTYKLTNPALDNGNDGWTGSATINYGCGEFYESSFNFNQLLTNMPAGLYQLSAQAFQRPGTTAGSVDVEVNVLLYIGAQTAKIAHIKDDAQSKKVGKGTEVQQNGLYVPNNMQAASAYFDKGLYDNSLKYTLATSGKSFRLGIRSSSMGTSYWVIFDNFRLHFFGNMTEEQLTGVKDLSRVTKSAAQTIYTLDGRRLSLDTQLRPGLYIIDGHKTIVK